MLRVGLLQWHNDQCSTLSFGNIGHGEKNARVRLIDHPAHAVVLGKQAGGHFPPTGTVSHNPCLPGLGIKNDVGFAIPGDILAQGADAAAEGWYGDDGTFYAFLVESVGADPDQRTAVSITRAQCRQRSATQMEWEIRGGTADPERLGAGRVNIGRVTPTGTVSLYDGAFTNAVADPLNPPFGLYTFKANINNQGACPETPL